MHTSMDLPDFPARRAVLHKIGGDFVQSVVGGDDFVILPEQLLQQRFFVRVEICLLDSRSDAVIQVEPRNTEFLAAVFVHQFHRRAVFLGALEVVARHVASEDAPGQIVVLEQRRASETYEGGIRKREAHITRELPSLCPMRFVGDDDDVIPFAVRLAWVDVLVKFVDEAENVPMIFLQKLFQFRT